MSNVEFVPGWIGLRVLAFSLVAAIVACPVSAASAPPPASAPAANPALARTFLATGLELLSKGDLAQAIGALQRAVQNDPSVAEAHYHLARALQRTGRTRQAIESYRRFVELPVDNADPAMAPLKADAVRQLARLDVRRRQWRLVREDYAKRFRSLAARHGGKPSCVRALELADKLTPDDAECGSELAAARKLLPAALGPAPAAEDPDGAKLLVNRAASLARSRKPDEAAKVLASVCDLARDSATLALVAEGYLAIRQPAEAAVVILEGLGGVDKVTDKHRSAVRARLLTLQRQADPGVNQTALLCNSLAGRAERLAGQAVAGKDYDTAREILTLVIELAPDRDSARKLLAKLDGGPAAPASARLPDLTSELITYTPKGGIVVTRTPRTFDVKGPVTKIGRGDGIAVNLTFTPLLWGRDMRATWRVQQVLPSPKDGGCLYVCFWPVANSRTAFVANGSNKEVGIYGIHVGLKRYYGSAEQIDKEAQKALYREDGTYDITFEKKGLTLTMAVNGHHLSRIVIKDPRYLSGKAVGLSLALTDVKASRLHIKATLLEFSFSPDCIKPK